MISTNQTSLRDGMEHKKANHNGKTSIIKDNRTPIHIEHKTSTKPKYIPHEPYKAAVAPLSNSISKNSSKVIVTPPTLRETHILFPLYREKTSNSCSENVEPPLLKILKPVVEENKRANGNEENCCPSECEMEKMALKEEIEQLREQYKELQQQFLIQTQVNSEVKKLLVASLGEDMQERVQFLTEDKAKLAQNIASYSQKILDDHEELERLEIQGDVWRSKFLASNVIVDELAGWKSKLVHKYELALEAIQGLFQEHQEIKHNMISTQRKLRSIRDTFDPMAAQHSKGTTVSCSLISLGKANKTMSEDLASRLIGPLQSQAMTEPQWDLTRMWTPAELRAKEVIASKDVLPPKPIKPDVNLGTSSPHSRCKYHKGINSSSIKGCSHCCGDVKVI